MYVCKARHMVIKKTHQKEIGSIILQMLIIISLMWKRKHCPFKERCYKYVQEQKHIM